MDGNEGEDIDILDIDFMIPNNIFPSFNFNIYYKFTAVSEHRKYICKLHHHARVAYHSFFC
jgi:hypothetical protein